MNEKENIVTYPNSLETRVALVEMAIVNVNQSLMRLDKKMDDQSHYMHQKFDKLFEEIKEIRKETRGDFKFLLRLYLASTAGLAAIMAHGFHWY